MFIASIEVEILIPYAKSLKDKRKIIKSLIHKLQNQFNISVAEIDSLERWQRGVIGIACVSNCNTHAKKQADTVLAFIHRDDRFEVGAINVDVI